MENTGFWHDLWEVLYVGFWFGAGYLFATWFYLRFCYDLVEDFIQWICRPKK